MRLRYSERRCKSEKDLKTFIKNYIQNDHKHLLKRVELNGMGLAICIPNLI